MKHLRTAPLALALSLPFLASCVSQHRYQDALEEKRLVQIELQDLRAFVGELESLNTALSGELAIYKGSVPIEAGLTREIDERLEALSRIAEGIVGSDVTLLQVEGGYGLRLDDAVLFDSGSAEVKPEGKELLKRMVAEISRASYERIWVRGHTDADPVTRPATLERFPQGNLQLSAARAVSVAAELVENGVSHKRLIVAGFGPNEPVAPNDTPENKRRNRRVEIFVLEQASPSPIEASAGTNGG